MNFPIDTSIVSITLSNREKAALQHRYALHQKYEKAVTLYADTDMSLKAIAQECDVTVGGLGGYLRRYWRELVLRRHQIPTNGKKPQEIKIMEAGRQNINAHSKYKKAIDASGSLEYIDLNLSQIARKFGVESTALANFMRIHYMDILKWREKVRHWLGINDNLQRGARPACSAQYAKAVELYRTTDMTVPEIAEKCKVSPSGFSQHLRFYHKGILAEKKEQRKVCQAAEKKAFGTLLGNGRKYQPAMKTEQKYAQALMLYRDTALTMKDIAQKTHVPLEGFRFYLHKWHKDLVLQRSGLNAETEDGIDLRKARKRMKTVTAKYEKAICSLRENPRPISQVAAEFGFNSEVFRSYLHKHEPDLAQQQGMMRTLDGKWVSRRSYEKYTEAVHLYETTTESLKSIAKRLGLTYNSVGGYVRRNYPEAIARHKALLEATQD